MAYLYTDYIYIHIYVYIHILIYNCDEYGNYIKKRRTQEYFAIII